jgi:hypothetical protein
VDGDLTVTVATGLELPHPRTIRASLGQNQLSLASALQSVELALVLDPNLASTEGQVVEMDDFPAQSGRWLSRILDRFRRLNRVVSIGRRHKS